MAIVAGIDEAGYGPMLGPLVVGLTAFRVPAEQVNADLWSIFQIGGKSDRKKTPGGVKVADSKALHRGRHGFRILEENLLPFFDIPGERMPSFRGLLERLGMENVSALRAYPWYGEQDVSLPHRANPQRVIDRAVQLRRALEAAGGEFCAARIEILNAAEYNRDVAETGNKSATAAKRVAALLDYLWDNFGLEGIRLVVDKQGGRNKYGEFLSVVLPEWRSPSGQRPTSIISPPRWPRCCASTCASCSCCCSTPTGANACPGCGPPRGMWKTARASWQRSRAHCAMTTLTETC